jgi:hypothetical protein
MRLALSVFSVRDDLLAAANPLRTRLTRNNGAV